MLHYCDENDAYFEPLRETRKRRIATCSMCGLHICDECVRENPTGVSLHLLRCDVVALLEAQHVREAVQRLQMHFDPQGKPVEVLFDGCEEDILKGYPGIAKANGERIIVCDTARADYFQYAASEEVPDYEKKYGVKHLTVIVLHEFGHVLDRRHMLPPPVQRASDDKEDRANAFVRYFLEA